MKHSRLLCSLLLCGALTTIPAQADIFDKIDKAIGKVDKGINTVGGLLGGETRGNNTPPKKAQNNSNPKSSNPMSNKNLFGGNKTSSTPQEVKLVPEINKSTNSAQILDMQFTGLTLNNPMFRVGDNDNLFLDQGGMSLKGEISIATNGLEGKRVIVFVRPIINGEYMADSYGPCENILAYTVPYNKKSAKISFGLPYGWMGIDMFANKQEPRGIQLEIEVMTNEDFKTALAERIITVDQENTKNIERNVQDNPMDVIFGGVGGQSGQSDLMGGLIDDFFGTGTTGTVTCHACDGTGLCDHCDGWAYIFPEKCHKCANNPGVCRRCKGAGQENVKIDLEPTIFW